MSSNININKPSSITEKKEKVVLNNRVLTNITVSLYEKYYDLKEAHDQNSEQNFPALFDLLTRQTELLDESRELQLAAERIHLETTEQLKAQIKKLERDVAVLRARCSLLESPPVTYPSPFEKPEGPFGKVDNSQVENGQIRSKSSKRKQEECPQSAQAKKAKNRDWISRK